MENLITITIELTDEQEARLRVLADAAGQTLEECAHDLLVRALDKLEAADRLEAERTEAK